MARSHDTRCAPACLDAACASQVIQLTGKPRALAATTRQEVASPRIKHLVDSGGLLTGIGGKRREEHWAAELDITDDSVARQIEIVDSHASMPVAHRYKPDLDDGKCPTGVIPLLKKPWSRVKSRTS